jgi:transposase
MRKKLAIFCIFAILFCMENAANYCINCPPKTLEEASQIILFQQESIKSQQEKIETIEQQYKILQQQLVNLLRGKYGKSSEKLDGNQLSLLGDNIATPELITEPVKSEVITYTRNKRNGHRNIPADLPRERIEYKLSDLTCPCGCGNQLHKIGEVITEQLEIVPAKIYVKEHVRFKYAGCAHQDQVITAAMPNQPIDKGFAGPGLLAEVLVNKYDDHLPLYRQSERLERHGIYIARQTLCDWVMQCADILNPLVEAMKPTLLASTKIHTDDTVVPVQEEGKNVTKKGRLWAYLALGPPCVIYDYSPSHEQKWALEFLKDYKGYLQADAYTGYNKLYAMKNIVEVGCNAHARRKFFEIVKGDPQQKTGAARTALDYIGKLYSIERRIKDFSAHAKEAVRKREAKPILKAYKRFLLSHYKRVLPKSSLGQAIEYTLNNWVALTRYLGNGILDIDNNKAERLMRPVTIGRSNWIFAGNDRGGRAAATIYSLIETCKLNKINPYDYLRDVLTRIPNTLNRDIKSLFPYHWKP